MALSVQTNIAALTAQRSLASTDSMLSTSMARLSSGLRVNSAKDDAAGLAIAERMNAQVKGMNVGIRNASDGISMAQTAEGALGSIGDLMQRMRELSVQSANGTNTASDRLNLDAEFQALGDEITRVVTSTEFNGLAVLGADSGTFNFQVGANNQADNRISVTTSDFSSAATITAVTGGDITSSTNAATAMTNLDAAIDTITSTRADLGAAQSRMESAISGLRINAENQAAARGRIMDADFATETANLTKGQVLQQAGTAMLAQANQASQNVLSLLR
ncbi:Flagellin protein FlaA [hydrothermal vent metagenome]|uniref:Flagellin protein FlaA n=1 Tax=hydrothermal vent metagenome TaxID=652676 RepID=A0A3B0YSU1_9ZZZZ